MRTYLAQVEGVVAPRSAAGYSIELCAHLVLSSARRLPSLGYQVHGCILHEGKESDGVDLGKDCVIRHAKRAQTQTFEPDIFWRGRGLPREGVGAKKFDMSLETK